MFARLGIAPTPFWVDRTPEGLPRQVLVYEWQEGAPPALEAAAQRLALAQAVAQVHTAELDELRRFSPRPVNLDYFWRVLAGGSGPTQAWLHELGALRLAAVYAELANGGGQLVERALPLWAGVLPAPIHGDLLAENVVVAGGVPILLDWELCGLGDPALEIARFLQDLRATLAADAAEDWLDSYLMAADQPGLAARVAVYRRLLPFQQLSFLLDGLRQLAPAERAAAEFQANAAALHATVWQTLAEACRSLDIASTPDESTLDGELGLILATTGEPIVGH
jgi:aminoglycoside phosphotransferase (APT) family kinase protein